MSIPEIILITPKIIEDERGAFMETFRQDEFEKNCGAFQFVQENLSYSNKNVLRGIHYQLNQPQGKLVRVLKGEIFDVAVDLRRTSKTFGKYYAHVLKYASFEQLWIPPGFGHGFLVLSDDAIISYKITTYYDPLSERTIRWDDENLSIRWPINSDKPILSNKDKCALAFEDSEMFP